MGRRWLFPVGFAFVTTMLVNLLVAPPRGHLKVDAWNDLFALVLFGVLATVVGFAYQRQIELRLVAQEQADALRRMHEESVRLNDERRRVSEEAATAQARADALEALARDRSALLRSVSHDLRTPLATVRAVATDLREGTAYDEATRKELLGMVCDEAERLDRLVSNLLSMSRIEAGALVPVPHPVDLDEDLRAMTERLRPLFTHARITVDVPPDLPLVLADHALLDLVVSNLLENASRYAPPRSAVRVGARALPGAAMVEVTVADEGPGVLPVDAERVFEPFQKGAESRSTGLGLAICRAVVEAHGGTISVRDTVGGGATFAFTLPAVAPRGAS